MITEDTFNACVGRHSMQEQYCSRLIKIFHFLCIVLSLHECNNEYLNAAAAASCDLTIVVDLIGVSRPFP